MAEVLAEFTDVIVADDETRYRAQVCGAPMPDGMWEGWLEFIPLAGGTPIRSARETTQPNRADAIYWATGLTAVYAEGSLRRALTPVTPKIVEPPQPLFDGPAPDMPTAGDTPPPAPDPVLDPFSVYGKGEVLLRKELSALSAWHLVNIIIAFHLSDEPVATLNGLPETVLIEMIVAAVRDRALARK